MRRHKMKHTNDRPYSCPYCDYSSIQSSTFKVHLRRKHEFQAQKDGLIFSCSYCTFKTVKKDNYLAHVGTHHISSADEQNKEAERQQQEINKATFKNRSRKPQNQILQKSTENNVSSSRQVILNSISNDEHFAYTNAEEALIQSVIISFLRFVKIKVSVDYRELIQSP
ncbi:hypothetical protein Avbf_08466 [Armadillidium vulgare]|nr:hypothetical protein Avbf_08466 [Armadillidium vulgare]